ncbi:MAG TPA: DoxX family protein [Stellaceae bacterium]|jgi:putative oxidoreductase|nr:DoxX family protein [Stellaceae bacterium]
MFESQAFREVWTPRLLSIVRILLGLIYLQHGLSKHFGFPGPQPANFQIVSMVGAAGAIEIVGSAMLILGLYTRWVALIISGEMFVAYFIYANRMAKGFFPLLNGGELEATFCLFFFVFFLVGGGEWTLDRAMHRHER